MSPAKCWPVGGKPLILRLQNRHDGPMAKQGSGCLILFSLPFAAIGVGMGVWMAITVAGHLNMQRWVETPATILQADLKASHDQDSTTYRATARYEYRYEGRRYTSERVSLSASSDNIGSFQRDVYRQLSECQQTHKPFRCYVNPARPREAILFRDLRWEMLGFQTLFMLAFGGAGFGLLISLDPERSQPVAPPRSSTRPIPKCRGCGKPSGPADGSPPLAKRSSGSRS